MTTFAWTDAEVRRALSLELQDADERFEFSGVSTDSRTLEAGQLYVALVGERFDGHEFIDEALARGARGVVASRGTEVRGPARVYPVKDTLDALGTLAAHRRSSLGVPVVAITGSSGKTTTKDMTAAALGAAKRVHATRGNLNNRVGMPLTLLAVSEAAEAVVLEMGTNEPGEIRVLAQIARPDIGVVTTVGEAHLQKLGSLEGVLDEKLDLLRNLASGGRCVVGDDPAILADGARATCPRLRVAGWSARADPDLRPERAVADTSGRYTFGWHGATVSVPIAGPHAVTDALLALAVAEMLGVGPAEAARGLAGTATSPMRAEIRRIGSLTVIVDCYNANPQSVAAALDILEAQKTAGRRVAVLGTMRELGAESARLHREAIERALGNDIDLLVATGEFERAAVELGVAALDRVITAPDWQAAYPLLKARLEGGEVVLLKASRGIALEGILPLLEADF
jgi:UDP-N-acetylmuramoyl-tripeptide--D-alanyl-D-alanine ligase